MAVAVAAAVVVAVLYVRAPRATRLHVGEVAPDFTLPGLADGVPLRLSSTRGGPVVLVFFDTRRPDSAAYLGYLEKMYRHYRIRRFRMVGVCLDRDVAAARAFVTHNLLTFTVLSDPDAAVTAPLFGAPQDPEAYLIDPAGRVEAVFTERIDWRDRGVREELERHLASPPPGW